MEIPASLLDRVIQHCRLAWPEEACGVLSGPRDDAGPRDFWPIRNAADHPRYRYAMPEGEQLATWKEIDAAGHKVFAIFHSHTAGDCEPSPEDIRHALDGEISHLIVALSRAEAAPCWALWQILHSSSAIEVPVTVT